MREERCVALRREHPSGTEHQCIHIPIAHLPNFFDKGQLEKLFFLFPIPTSRRQPWRRIIQQSSWLSTPTLSLLEADNTITDVEELGTWMAEDWLHTHVSSG